MSYCLWLCLPYKRLQKYLFVTFLQSKKQIKPSCLKICRICLPESSGMKDKKDENIHKSESQKNHGRTNGKN